MTRQAVHVIVLLECGHDKMITTTTPMEALSCFLCDGKPHKIVGILVREWHVQCTVCRYSRWVGRSSVMGNQMANAHFRKTGHSKITVEEETNPASERLFDKACEMGVLTRKGDDGPGKRSH